MNEIHIILKRDTTDFPDRDNTLTNKINKMIRFIWLRQSKIKIIGETVLFNENFSNPGTPFEYHMKRPK